MLSTQETPLEEGLATTLVSCLEKLMDRKAWQATVHSITKSWARLKRLSMHTRTYLRDT